MRPNIVGLRKNMRKVKRADLEGRGAVGKAAVVGVKDRETNQVLASVIEETNAETLQGFICQNAASGATAYTDDAKACKGMPHAHESVTHSVGEYVRDIWFTQTESSRSGRCSSALTRICSTSSATNTCNGTSTSSRIVATYRELDTIAQMEFVVIGLVGKRLMYSYLTANNGLSPGVRS